MATASKPARKKTARRSTGGAVDGPTPRIPTMGHSGTMEARVNGSDPAVGLLFQAAGGAPTFPAAGGAQTFPAAGGDNRQEVERLRQELELHRTEFNSLAERHNALEARYNSLSARCDLLQVQQIQEGEAAVNVPDGDSPMRDFFKRLPNFLWNSKIFYFPTECADPTHYLAQMFFLMFGSMEGFDSLFVQSSTTGPVDVFALFKQKCSDTRKKFWKQVGEGSPRSVLEGLFPGLNGAGEGDAQVVDGVPNADEIGMRVVARVLIESE